MAGDGNANIIVLLTDFGTRDYFVGAMKGTILSINPNAKIVDITHEIPPQDIRAAAFTLRACYQDFPEETILVAVVDPGVGSARKAILAQSENHYFIAPDNGLLSFVFDETNPRVFELTNKKYFAEDISSTFHGRDVFARVAAHLSNGVAPNEFGAPIHDLIHFEIAAPRRISDERIEAEIIHIDRFGNLITNLTSDDLPEKFSLEINEIRIGKHLKYYADAKSDEIFSIFGSAGFLEVAAFRDSAKNLLNAEIGRKVLLIEKS